MAKHLKNCGCNPKLDQEKVIEAKVCAREQQKKYCASPAVITKKGLYRIKNEVTGFVKKKESVLGFKNLNPGNLLFYDKEDKLCRDLIPPDEFSTKTYHISYLIF